MIHNNRNLNLRPDPPDQRDHLFHFSTAKRTGFWNKFFGLFKNSTAEKVDLRPWDAPIKDQGDLGACTGFAYSGLRELLVRKYFQFEPEQASIDPNAILSPLYIYYRERELEGVTDQDSGAYMRDGCRVLGKFGVCPEQEDPYNPRNFRNAPTPQMDTDATKFSIFAYHRLVGIEQFKECLRRGYPFAIGINCYAGLFSVDGDGILTIPVKGEEVLGGHAVLVVGFNDEKQWFIVRNSWGAGWGDGGYFYMPYAYITPENIQDAWMCVVNPDALV